MKIDLAGPNGNGLTLLCIAYNAALQLGHTEEKASDITLRMQRGSYIDLLNVMEEELPWVFKFAHDPRAAVQTRRSERSGFIRRDTPNARKLPTLVS